MLVDADSPELAELVRLRELGLQIALDDFGTGYSPLTYLKRLPATMLKLDKSFVAGLDLPVPDPIDVAIARSVLQLADEIGLQVVAEGVETESQMRLLSTSATSTSRDSGPTRRCRPTSWARCWPGRTRISTGWRNFGRMSDRAATSTVRLRDPANLVCRRAIWYWTTRALVFWLVVLADRDRDLLPDRWFDRTRWWW